MEATSGFPTMDRKTSQDEYESSGLTKDGSTIDSPIRFHNIHGKSIKLSRGAKLVTRIDIFDMGLAFSDRPIQIDEIILLKMTGIACCWNRAFGLGVTNFDPVTLKDNLPQFASPDLTKERSCWVTQLPQKFCAQGTVLKFILKATGELYYSIDGVEKGIFLRGINVLHPLWIVVDIEWKFTGLEIIDDPLSVSKSALTEEIGKEIAEDNDFEIIYDAAALVSQENKDKAKELHLPIGFFANILKAEDENIPSVDESAPLAASNSTAPLPEMSNGPIPSCSADKTTGFETVAPAPRSPPRKRVKQG